MNRTTPSRDPYQNDLLTDSGMNSCLHEQGTPMTFTTHNTQEAHLTLDFMLSVPFLVDTKPVNISITSSTTKNLDSRHVPDYAETTSRVWMPWAVAALTWGTYIKRNTEVSLVPFKCFTPSKLRLDIHHSNSTATDYKAKRNFTQEFDFSGCCPYTFNTNTITQTTYKYASIMSPNDGDFGVGTKGLTFTSMLDCSYQLNLIGRIQPGMIFPTSYNVYTFMTFRDAILSTLTTPSMIYSLLDNQINMRNVFMLRSSYMKSTEPKAQI